MVIKSWTPEHLNTWTPEFLETFTFNEDFILGQSSDYKRRIFPPSFVADEGQNFFINFDKTCL